jgi:hypothetical protein
VRMTDAPEPPPMRTEIVGAPLWAMGCFIAVAVCGLALVGWVIVVGN